MSRVSSKTSSTRMQLYRKKKELETETRLKPFGFCCSMDTFDPLTRYDQRMPPYNSSPKAITSVHECPVSKLQVEYFIPRQIREKRKFTRIKTSMAGDQLVKSSGLNYFQSNKEDGSIRWYLEDEIALAKDIFWMERQKIYNEMYNRAIKIAKKKQKSYVSYLKCPRWYQDFSPKQMKNLMNLENTMHVDYEEAITSGTQTILITIGIISTFFKFGPNIIRQLQTSCNLDSVCFLQEVYKILTGNDFQEEGYKKFYDCNERIILSAIAFLTLPEIVIELHRRLPGVIIPKLSPKPRPPICLTRRKNSCPYKEELFKPSDWAGYRNDLQQWWKKCKLLPIPKVILPLTEYRKSFIDNEIPSKFNKRKGKDIYAEHLEETNVKEQQIFDQRDAKNVDQVGYQYKNITNKENLYTKESETFDIQRPSDENKKFNFMITGLGEKSAAVEYKICGMMKPPGAGKKSWLGGKEPHYIIAGASENPPSCFVTYEITGVADVTPTNSDEKFFAVLKLGDGPRKIFPSGREHLSRNWQEWLFNVDEEFRRLQREADELIKSVRATTRLVFPEPVCDSCCSCRQTAKTREKLRQTKTPYLLIDNVLKNKEEIKYIVGSMVLHSPAPSPTGSEVNLLEMVASQDEIKTNIIINGVTNENGKTQYYISGVQKEKVHIPSRIPDPPVPQTISLQPRNVPPCACVIQQMFNKDVSSSASKDDIFWTKSEGLCMGKKYRPDEPGAYSCKMYPGDKSCRRNPFKQMMKIKEQEEEEGRKEKTEPTEVKEPIQVSEKKIPEKKSRFIPDPDYPAYDDPWNIARTAPSAKELVTDYEKSLKLTLPLLPAVSSPSKMQRREKGSTSSGKILKKSDKNIAIKETGQKVPSKISSKSKTSTKRIQGKRNKEKKHTENMNVKKKNVQVSSKNIASDTTDVKLSNKISTSKAMDKTKKQQLILFPTDKSAKQQQSDKANKMRKSVFIKKDKKKVITNGTDQVDSRKREMERLKTMMKTYTGLLGDVQPAVLPWEQPSPARPEEKFGDTSIDEEESRRISKEPCGWRTKSEQELPAKKTLVYLCEPDYPLEMVAVRPGGRSCRCRENRSKKKMLMYNVSGLVDEKKNGRRAKEINRRTKLKDENRIIDGVTYFTPPVSPRRSNEYVPEYGLLESPYDRCVGGVIDKSPKLLEKHSEPKSLVEKIQKSELCSCINRTDRTGIMEDISQKKEIEEARQKLMESKSPEERWKMALKDAALMEYFTQSKYDAFCRASHKENKQSGKPLRLKMVKPVCECKYERKIVERNEERAKWKTRQQKLKALKKQPFMHIVDTSRPMVLDTKFIISDVKRIPLEDEYADEVKYCITGVAENLTMSPPQRVVDGLKMHTPVVTPKPSKEDFRDAPHRHWSPMDIPPGPLPRRDAVLKEEMERRKRVRDEAFRMIYGEDERDASRLEYRDCPETCYKKKSMNIVENNSELGKINTNVEKQVPEALVKSHLPGAKESSSKIRRGQNVAPNKVTVVSRERIKYPEEAVGGSGQQDAYEQTIERTQKENVGETGRVNDDGDGRHPTEELDLMTIVKAELKKMAAEGYIFAKLPECYLIPQLQDWIMYRKGVAFSKIDREALMQHTFFIWKQLDMIPQPKIELPSLHMTKRQLRKLTYDRAEEIKKKIEKEIAIFHSKIRKSRVSYARSSWGSMEFGKFPSAWFKRAFFTYMASKEAD